LFQLEGQPFTIFAPIKSQISTGQDFDYIIKGYCFKGRFGDRQVMRGDYEVICPDDGQIINPSQIESMAAPGTVLEMSIIVRKHHVSFRDHKEKCPRCQHINLNATLTSGWIEWKVFP
jgi:hypothetical protein